jgi:hypothetical protein
VDLRPRATTVPISQAIHSSSSSRVILRYTSTSTRINIYINSSFRGSSLSSSSSTTSITNREETNRDENSFGIFRYSGNRFRIFSIEFTGNGIFRNRIGFRNFLSESVSESVCCFTDRFLRLLIFVGNYWICVSEFSGIVSRNFLELCLGIFQHVIFRIACTSLDKDYLFCIFLDALRFFGIDGVGRKLGLTIWSLK